ncbi:vWA domain-containing protein [Fervidibacillus albus]|uniref:BatA and WFA domain-containing protein n=1 Tax=Fervidibacillus albus TaxID=2980026 RepID=A0A9E8LWM3_9BACI|nr:BatA and WFA domain-containing protein [Fervidibacillus albus]WAA10685.1 BatA and WFA domain-containing protein [Fervidibacillus albus]
MGFLYPFMFGLTLFVLLFIVLYFFRKQYEEKIIPSNMLWTQLLNEREASRFFHKWQNHLLFWLQLFALIFLMIALTRPFFITERETGEELIFVVDPSATMSTRVDSVPIFERHREEMLAIVDRLYEQVVTIITAGVQPEIVIWKESDQKKLKETIENLAVTYEHENIENALRFAKAFSNQKTAIHLFSDGVKQEDVSKIINDRYVSVHNVDKEVINVSLQSFVVDREDDNMKGLVVVKNESNFEKEASFTVEGERGIVFQTSIAIQPDSTILIPIDSLPNEKFYRGVLKVEDDYVQDNFSTVILHSNRQPVYILGDISPFFVRGLESIGVDVYQIDAEETIPKGEGIVATDDVFHVTNEHSAFFFFERSTEGFIQNTGPIEQVNDPLLNYVDMGNVYISQSRSTSPFSELESIVSVDNRPLIQKGKVSGVPTIAFLFPFEQTDWPMHPNFPIFLYNSYEWLAQQSTPIAYFQPGEKKWLAVDQQSFEIFTLEGKRLYSINTEEEAFQAPYEPGLYQAVSDNKIYYFCVLLDDREKTVATEQSFILNDTLLDGTMEGGKTTNIELLSLMFAFIAFLLLIVEWEVYRKWLK